ncbi:QWRF motif-containing protein 2-like [Phalaenopsis equestris]|uniref:QWRF motif-containing protein 2-like n=1 Tax=Phalaenopsis equestris TaxID=78828 RepID=UPI0009E62BB1|nr:QWRF motif-containing protein 2-like [Phalaenopsis equestris]XP_020580230.1 QWRF motif-containing protein 2-like [Phalaenopsis equestris]
MVIAAPAAVVSHTATTSVRKNTPVVTRPNDPSAKVSRRPLTPSERDNAGFSRRPRSKEISSRYLSSYSSSSSSTTSTSYSTNSTFSSSLSTFPSRRFSSPLANHRASTPSSFPKSLTSKRSQSVDRTRSSTPLPDPRGASTAEGSDAAGGFCTTTRSLSVSFQDESFFYQTSKAKADSTTPFRKPTPDRRRPTTPVRNSSAVSTDLSETSRTPDHCHRWPAARSRKSSLLTKSLDCSGERNDLLTTVQLLRQSMLVDGGSGWASFVGAELSASSDTDSVSSGSNSGVHELNAPRHARVTSCGISMPARFWQDTNNRLRRLPELGTPVSSGGSMSPAMPQIASVRRSVGENSLSRFVSSPLRGAVRPSSPSKLAGSPSRGVVSPLRARSSSTLVSSLPARLTANAPSIISFSAEVRRAKKGENRIEEAHMLRLLHDQHLQWRYVNARANAALMIQRVAAEKHLYNAWITISEMRDLVTIKKTKLHFLTQNLKLTTILKSQMVYLEETSLLDREHSSSLAGAIESLKASTLRLPVVSGARANLQEVKNAVGSAVNMLQAMGASMHSLMSKVQDTSSLVSELAKVAAKEQALLDQSRNLLTTVAALHVKHCSLRGHLLQLKR